MKKFRVLVMVGGEDIYYDVVCKEEEVTIVASGLWRAAEWKYRKPVACVVSEDGNPCDRRHFDIMVTDCM